MCYTGQVINIYSRLIRSLLCLFDVVCVTLIRKELQSESRVFVGILLLINSYSRRVRSFLCLLTSFALHRSGVTVGDRVRSSLFVFVDVICVTPQFNLVHIFHKICSEKD